MNTRLLYVILFTQVLFAGALLYIGRQSRANRKQDYLELTHRVMAGHGRDEDFEKLIDYLPKNADKTVVRSLFGLPVARMKQIETLPKGKDSLLKGDFWLYYPVKDEGTPEAPATIVDTADVENLKGELRCFIIEFNDRGRVDHFRTVVVEHPLAGK
jgi:hypothetical protein